MERAPEYHREPEKPREIEISARIEGKVEKPFTEVDPDQMQPVPLHDISWGDTTLAFQEVGRDSIPVGIFSMEIPVILYTGELTFKKTTDEKSKANLSRTTSKKSVLFTGNTHGFYAYDLAFGGRDAAYYVVGIQPDELERNMSRLAAVYHELGHSLIFDGNLDAMILQAAISLRIEDLPDVRSAVAYSNLVAKAIPDHVRSDLPHVTRANMRGLEADFFRVGKWISLFHERNAWAAGMNVARSYGSPTGFDDPHSYFDYARLCLSTYARSYKDDRFVRGFK